AWMGDPDPNEPTAQELVETQGGRKFSSTELDFFQKIRPEFSDLTPPDGSKTIHFIESSDGLPTSGSWRNSLTGADMNGDGFPDIITPPERAGGNVPVIFLGDGKGHWKLWTDVKWPHGIDYGSVVAADFNHDGKMDLAFAVHLTGLEVLLGDGKGNFVDSSN